MSKLAIGIDIGGTGIKGALVDVKHGELVSDRVKVATPEGGDPDAILQTVAEMVNGLAKEADGVPIGVSGGPARPSNSLGIPT